MSETRRTLTLPRPERAQPPAEHYLREIETLRARLDDARKEIAAMTRRLSQDGDLPVLRPAAFAAAQRRATDRQAPDRPGGALARIVLTNLPDLLGAHGAEAADAATVHIAQTLAGQVRADDVVGRIGAGAFGVLLAHAELDAAREKMRRLVARLEGAGAPHGEARLPLRLSLTVAPLQV